MMEKHTYDVRGKQSMLLRLISSDKEGFLHLLFYRIAIIFSFVTLAVMLWSLHSKGTLLTSQSELCIVIFGVLMTPQLFESLKAFMLILSGGMVFGKLNDSFLKFSSRKSAIYQLYNLIPYILIVIWAIGLVWLTVLWSI